MNTFFPFVGGIGRPSGLVLLFPGVLRIANAPDLPEDLLATGWRVFSSFLSRPLAITACVAIGD